MSGTWSPLKGWKRYRLQLGAQGGRAGTAAAAERLRRAALGRPVVVGETGK